MDQSVISTVTIQKRRIAPEKRMLAKELLLAHFPPSRAGGQLIIHFTPGAGAAIFVEWQERQDQLPQPLQKVG